MGNAAIWITGLEVPVTAQQLTTSTHLAGFHRNDSHIVKPPLHHQNKQYFHLPLLPKKSEGFILTAIKKQTSNVFFHICAYTYK